MDEYLHEIENAAKAILAERFGVRPAPEESPILELATSLLEDGAGGVRESRTTVTTDEWLRWNRLLLEKPSLLQNAASEILSEEEFPLPTTDPALLDWAAWLIVSTLDRL